MDSEMLPEPTNAVTHFRKHCIREQISEHFAFHEIDDSRQSHDQKTDLSVTQR